MKRFLYIFLSIVVLSCNNESGQIIIGFSYPDLEVTWNRLLYEEMLKELNLYQVENIKFIGRNANNQPQQQNDDIRDLVVDKHVDVLIVHPVNQQLVVPVIEQVYDMGIPVIIHDNRINSTKYSSTVEFSNIEFGYQAVQYMSNKLDAGSKIIEVTGEKSVEAVILRSKGFKEALDSFPRLTMLASVEGAWSDSLVQYRLDSLFRQGLIPDAIFAHNDRMALSARKVSARFGIKPLIVGVDGMAYAGGGIDMILNGDIDATFYNRPGGDVCIDMAVTLAKGGVVEKDYFIKTFPIDKFNAEGLRHGFDLVQDQQTKFEILHKQIRFLSKKIRFQRLFTYLSILLLLLMLIIVAITLYFLKQKQKYILVINEKTKDIENKIEEEKALVENLTQTNTLLQEQRVKILQQNQALEKYQDNLEKIVEERTKELSKALQKARESDDLKASFIANLSHELRTPINAITGFSELLFVEDYPIAERRRYHRLVMESCFELMRLVENILEISLASSGQMRISKTELRLKEFFGDYCPATIDKYQAGAFGKVKPIQIVFEEVDDISVVTDNARLEEVLDQLIHNAVKFTKEGVISVGGRYQSATNQVLFYVKDTGIGIKPEFQELIFENFRKVEDTNKELYRGNGLGLAISKYVIEYLGGKIWVESEFGKGSSFYFTLPVGPKNVFPGVKATPEMKSAPTIEGSTILIAEDEEVNFMYLQEILKTYSVKILWAQDGLEAIQLCRQHDEVLLALMDIKMPRLDGLKALAEMRACNIKMPVIALTAYAQVKDKERFLTAGFDAYLSKPVKPEKLMQTIVDVLSKYAGSM